MRYTKVLAGSVKVGDYVYVHSMKAYKRVAEIERAGEDLRFRFKLPEGHWFIDKSPESQVSVKVESQPSAR